MNNTKIARAIERLDAILFGTLEARLKIIYDNQDLTTNEQQARLMNANQQELLGALNQFANGIIEQRVFDEAFERTVHKKPRPEQVTPRELLLVLIMLIVMFSAIFTKIELAATAEKTNCGDYDVSVYPNSWELETNKTRR